MKLQNPFELDGSKLQAELNATWKRTLATLGDCPRCGALAGKPCRGVDPHAHDFHYDRLARKPAP